MELSIAIVGSNLAAKHSTDPAQADKYEALNELLEQVQAVENFPDTEDFWEGTEAYQSTVCTYLPIDTVGFIARAIETAHSAFDQLTPLERDQLSKPMLRLIVSPTSDE